MQGVNPLLLCSSETCPLEDRSGAHMKCVGLTEEPEDWYCQACSNSSGASSSAPAGIAGSGDEHTAARHQTQEMSHMAGPTTSVPRGTGATPDATGTDPPLFAPPDVEAVPVEPPGDVSRPSSPPLSQRPPVYLGVAWPLESVHVTKNKQQVTYWGLIMQGQRDISVLETDHSSIRGRYGMFIEGISLSLASFKKEINGVYRATCVPSTSSGAVLVNLACALYE